MNYNEAVKKQESKTEILEKLTESIMIGEVDCKDKENLSSSVKSPNDVIKSRKNSILVFAYHQGVIFKRFKEIACLRVQLPILK